MAAGSAEPLPRLAVVALGCRVSQAEADALPAALEGALAPAGDGPADVVVVNTCTVTADAARAARQAVRRAAREHPGARIVAAGCHAEVCGAELAALPGVSAVVGAREQGRLAEVVRGLLARAGGAAAPRPEPSAGHGRSRLARRILKVQDGCSARCSYCVVPLARGPGRSLPPGEVLAGLRALGAATDEVVLAGVHLGAYGQDLAPRSSLDALLDSIVRARPVHRLRLSSVEPHELPAAALSGPARGLLCEHLHLPVQSGSDAVLRAMRRPYRAGDAARALDLAAALLPGAALGLDLLCGFPGETDEDHRATLRLVEASPAAYLHVFGYSPRPGTDAARLPPSPRGVVRARVAELRALGERRWRAFLDGLAGRQVEAIVERVEDGVAHGTSREFAPVRWPAGGERRGAAVRVEVAGRDGDVLAGARAR